MARGFAAPASFFAARRWYRLACSRECLDARIDDCQCRSGTDRGGCHRACVRRLRPGRLRYARQSACRRKQRSGLCHCGAQPDVAQRGHRKASQRPAGLQYALADFNKAISLDPNYTQAYANRGLVYRKTGKLDLAQADYDKALSLDAGYATAYVGRGMVESQQGKSAQALADFNKAIALKPDNAEAYYSRGLLYQSQHQHQFAIDDFSTALGLTTQRSDLFVARGLSYLAVGDNKSAASDLDQAVQADPTSAKAWASRGLAYERLGLKEKAAGSYAKALNINDKYQPAQTGFARVGGRAGQTYQTF